MTATEALRDAMKYVETTDGTRGELCGCAVNALTYLEWMQAANEPEAQDVIDVLRDDAFAIQVADQATFDVRHAIFAYRAAVLERINRKEK